MTPGSSAPVRVPIGSPSRPVKPIVLAMLRPPSSAHMLAPLPEVEDHGLAARGALVVFGQHRRRCIRTTARGDRSGARPRPRAPWAARTSARRAGTSGASRCRSRPPAAAPARARAPRGSRARLWGRCSGASGTSFSSFGEQGGVDAGGRHVVAPAVGDAVTDRGQAMVAAVVRPGASRRCGRTRRRGRAARRRRPALLGQRSRRPRPSATKRGARADPLDLAAGDRRQRRAAQREHRELDARRAGVQDQDRVGHLGPRL